MTINYSYIMIIAPFFLSMQKIALHNNN